jgi:preprotein translocase subunit SecA
MKATITNLPALFGALFSAQKRTVKKIRRIQNRYAKSSTEALCDDFVDLRNSFPEQVEEGEGQDILNMVLPTVFAIAIEILNRSSVAITDSQIAGGIALHQGSVFESSKNEDNIYAIILAAILNSLTKQGVHIAFINESLTKKYYEKFKPVLSALKISADSICEYTENTEERYNAYNADILFGEIFQYCFDSMRKDNIDHTSSIKRGFVLIDNADILLIDNAFTTAQLTKPEGEEPRYAAIITPYLLFKQYKKMAGISCTARNNKQDYKNLYSLKVRDFRDGKNTRQIPAKNLIYKTRREKYSAIVQYMRQTSVENKFVIVDVRDSFVASSLNKEEQMPQYGLFKAILKAWKVEHAIAEEDLSNMEKGKVLITDNLENIILNSNNADIISASDLVVLVLEKYPNHNVNLFLQKNLSHASIHFFISAEDEIMEWRAEEIQSTFVKFGFKEGEGAEIGIFSRTADRGILQLKNIQSGYYKYIQDYIDILQDQYVRLKARREVLLSHCVDFPGNPEINLRRDKILKQCLPIVKNIVEQEGEKYEKLLIPFSVGETSMSVSVNIQNVIDSEGRALIDGLNNQVFEYTIRECWEEQLTKFFNLHHAYEKAIREKHQQFTDFIPMFDYDSLLNKIEADVENRLSNSFLTIKGDASHHAKNKQK